MEFRDDEGSLPQLPLHAPAQGKSDTPRPRTSRETRQPFRRFVASMATARQREHEPHQLGLTAGTGFGKDALDITPGSAFRYLETIGNRPNIQTLQ